MKRLLFCVIVLFTGVAGAAEAEETRYKMTGETSRCIDPGDVDWFTVVDSDTMLFGVGDKYFFNNLKGRCNLPDAENVRITISGKQRSYCMNNGVLASVLGKYTNNRSCTLGRFHEAVEVGS